MFSFHTHKPIGTEVVGRRGGCGKAELNFPKNAWSIILQNWENYYHVGQIAWLPMQPQMPINKALITLIRAISSRRASHYSGALSQPWSQDSPWLILLRHLTSHCFKLLLIRLHCDPDSFLLHGPFWLSNNRCRLLEWPSFGRAWVVMSKHQYRI